MSLRNSDRPVAHNSLERSERTNGLTPFGGEGVPGSLETNWFCERFHRTVNEEFYAVAFRKKFHEASTSCSATSTPTSRSMIASAPTKDTAPRDARRFMR